MKMNAALFLVMILSGVIVTKVLEESFIFRIAENLTAI
jgi:hypothetical protein